MEIRETLSSGINSPLHEKPCIDSTGKSSASADALSINDSVSLSSAGTGAATIQAPSVRQQVAQAPRPSISQADLPAMPKDLYRVERDGSVKKVTFIYDADGRKNIDNLTLIGSWDANTGRYSVNWDKSATPMQKDDKGRWVATLNLQDDGPHDWQWGVLADGPSGRQKWAIFDEGNLRFNLRGDNPVATYSPTTYTRMGATRDGDDINFKFWSPHAKSIKVKIWDKDPDKAQYVPLEKDHNTNLWSGGIKGGWSACEGKYYAYEIVTSEGNIVLKNDPYARYLQGQQRGIGDLYLHRDTAQEVHKYYRDNINQQQGKQVWELFKRFEVQGHEKADAVYLTFTDEMGQPMTKDDLLKRLGRGKPELVRKFHGNKFSDYWLDNVDDNGRIKLVKQGNAWATILNNPDALPGMSYKFEVHEKNADGSISIVGDTNKDGILSPEEAKNTTFNDPYSGTISDEFGFNRYGIIKEPKFEWKNDNAPRIAKSREKAVIYQLHVGSIFGQAGNVDRSDFGDIIKRLQYFKDLGVTDLELMPVNTFEGSRDWGYIGTSSFAMSDQYGFTDEDGKWVSGTDAVKYFIDAAHGMGFNVINDVVYNHWGGDYNNMWELDGKKNPVFDWEENPTIGSASNQPGADHTLMEGAKSVIRGSLVSGEFNAYRHEPADVSSSDYEASFYKAVKHTDWGAMPAYNKPAVRQFIIDNAMAQLDEFHFDGLRFDFTHPMHAQIWGGGSDGWNLLRNINRQVRFFHPNAHTVAEEFPNNEVLTRPALQNGKGGAGFDAMWNTEFQHRLVHDSHNPSILQQAARGLKTDMDKFISHLVSPPGFETKMNSITVISNHDEVGNADRTVNVAMNHQQGIPDGWARNAARMTFGVGMLSPGVPIFFQGEESLAVNKFKWGIPSTWDVGWDWLDVGKDWDLGKVNINDDKVRLFRRLIDMPKNGRENSNEYKSLSDTDKKVFDYIASVPSEKREDAIMNIFRKLHFNYCKDVIALRRSSPAFDGDAEVKGIYTHNDNSVMAFTRKKNGEEFVVVGSLNKENLGNYNLPFPDGRWRLVCNSDASFYGGENFGSKIEVNGGPGTVIDIPRGGMLVYKRVG